MEGSRLLRILNLVEEYVPGTKMVRSFLSVERAVVALVISSFKAVLGGVLGHLYDEEGHFEVLAAGTVAGGVIGLVAIGLYIPEIRHEIKERITSNPDKIYKFLDDKGWTNTRRILQFLIKLLQEKKKVLEEKSLEEEEQLVEQENPEEEKEPEEEVEETEGKEED